MAGSDQGAEFLGGLWDAIGIPGAMVLVGD